MNKTPKQEEAMKLLGGDYSRVLLYGGSRCIHGDTRLLTPYGYRSVQELYSEGKDFIVASYNQDTNRFEWTPAEAPFIKGYKNLVEVTLKNGSKFKCTPEHRVLTDSGWKQISDVLIDEDLLVCFSSISNSPDLSEVVSIKKFDTPEIYYDLTVPSTHNYVAEGVVHHNSGKTFITTYALVYRALKCPNSRHLILRRYIKNVKTSVLLDTFPKVMSTAFPGVTYKASKHEGLVTFANGSEIWFNGLDDEKQADKILGTEYSTIYFNESSEISYNNITTVLSRLAQNVGLKPKAWFDCNPPHISHWLYKWVIDRKDPISEEPIKFAFPYLQMNPVDNKSNLPEGYIEETLASLPEKQRLRFLHGNFQADDERALWRREWITRNRVSEYPDLYRIYIGVDPAISAGDLSDETGIVVAGIDKAGIIYILDDVSLKGTPKEWASEVVRAYYEWNADAIIAETNQGGQMVTHTIKTIDPIVNVREVKATRGKAKRAEPISSLSERNEVKFTREFETLEAELCTFVPGEEDVNGSPNRADAMVWACTKLLETRRNKVKVVLL